MIRYLVIGGTVTSQTDGQTHYIWPGQLMKLYRVEYRECLLATSETDAERILAAHGKDRDALVVLRPRFNGDYRITGKER